MLHLHAKLLRARVVGRGHGKTRSTAAVDPLVKEAVHVDVRCFLDGLDEVRGDDVPQPIHFEIVLQGVKEGVVAQLLTEHFEHEACFAVDISRVLKRVAEIVRDDGHIKQAPLPEPSGLCTPARVGGIVGAILVLFPQCGHEGGEPFVEPQVRPILAGDQIAEPLMAHLMRDQPVSAFQALAGELRVQQATSGKRGRAHVFHSADSELIDGGLVIFIPGVREAQAFGKETQHLGSTREGRLDALAFTPRHAILDGDIAPALFAFVELTGHQRNQVRGDRLGLPPGPRFHSGLGIDNLLELAIRDGHPVARNGDDHLGGGAIVGIIVDGNVIAGILGLTLGPDFLRLCRIAFIRQNEIEALLGAALVTNDNLVFFARFAGASEVHAQFRVVGRKMSFLTIETGAQNLQADGIEIQLAQAVL